MNDVASPKPHFIRRTYNQVVEPVTLRLHEHERTHTRFLVG